MVVYSVTSCREYNVLYGSSATLTGFTILGNKPYTDYTEKEYIAMEKKLAKRTVEIELAEGLFYPIKKGALVLFNKKLVIQAIFGAHIQSKLRTNTIGLEDFEKDLKKLYKETEQITLWNGRVINVDSPHKMLNYSCQGNGAVAMKVYIRIVHKKLANAGLNWGEHFIQQAVVYDEIDFIVRDDCIDILEKILLDSYSETSRELGMKTTYTGEVLMGQNWGECH